MKESVMYRTPATAALVVVGLLVALAAVLWVGVGPAEAAFPGSNGKIAFESNRDEWDGEIYTMDPDGSGIERLTNNSAFDGYPAYSANGKKIAFESSRDEDPDILHPESEIYTMNADGSDVRRLTDNPSPDYEPAWSPDGSRIAFLSFRHDFRGEIYTMNASDGSGLRRLTFNSAFDNEPAWSPDGSRIAFVSSRDGNSEIYTMNARDGSGVQRLTNHPEYDADPAWSPDGSKIAFVSTRHDGRRSEIYTMNARDGSGLTRLTNSAGNENPAWSPDGSRIAFVNIQDEGYEIYNAEIYTMNANDGSGLTRLTNNPADDAGPDWQPLPSPRPPIDVDPILPTPPICSSSRAWWCEFLINEPIIREVPPAPGLIIRDHVPPIHLTPIKALVRDKQTDLKKEDIQLFVDGIRESGFSYEKDTDTLSYAVDELSVGKHEVRIVARDVQGNATTETWSFEVAKR